MLYFCIHSLKYKTVPKNSWGNWFFTKGADTVQWRKEPFQQMVMDQLDIHRQKSSLDLNLTSYRKINWKWIIDLNVNINLKAFRKKLKEKVFGFQVKQSLRLKIKSIIVKGKFDKLDLIKIENFSVKDLLKRMKRERKCLQTTYPTKDWASRTYKELSKLNS